MTTKQDREEIYEYWNSKGIVVHRRLNSTINHAIQAALSNYSKEELKELIDLYATILEKGTPYTQKKYFWTYKWNLFEFLKRGLNSLEGKEPDDYLKNPPQSYDQPTEALVFKKKER